MRCLLNDFQHLGRVELAAARTISPPLTNVGMKNAAPACDSGVHIRNRGCSGHSHSASWIMRHRGDRLPVVPMTPLGLPVVPPV